MGTGAITAYIDVAQITLYVFWVFFAGLIYYLHQESKREGYPLESDRSGSIKVQGFPAIPDPKTYKLQDGRTVTAPNFAVSPQTLKAVPSARFPGAPLNPTGNPMLDGVGPGAYADRADIPDVTYDGRLRIVPLRADTAYGVAHQDADPRGLPVVGADGKVGGVVRDLWVDRSEAMFRYLELDVPVGGGTRRVMLPINFSRIGARQVKVASILGHHFSSVPGLASPDQITFLEEEKVMAYYGGGTLYAEPGRKEPLL
ncbi:photosynthetic reaction center subunit H [Methyloversatilis sp.]|uniref:photosynthetic reaction center subunit H n=1 Tax=Methyloversatilis sp. TaxID=2569862 RepID=UPI002736645A|nr:photosynthetic reaction center subunit H [Methyloversatilis sp.]MDP2868723.1 photosynthetic reaction center subunit H [Methyloversatilis sp.]MDP3456600.1 photosynthetic reaction center subunit H [Methyloversatilis sp.]MDP3578986.1 photosynthetic reaction center subunit H [Methyloversatilis sp.]